MWAQCRGGDAFHTYPDLECLELIGSFLDMAEVEGTGELLWSSLAWHGTAFFRLRTNTKVTLRDGTCPNCGRIGPRLLLGGASRSVRKTRAPSKARAGTAKTARVAKATKATRAARTTKATRAARTTKATRLR